MNAASAATASRDLRLGRLGVPLVPDRAEDVVARSLRTLQAGREPQAADDGTGAEVGRRVSDRPLGGIGGRPDLCGVERLQQTAQSAVRSVEDQKEGFGRRVSHGL